MIAVSDLRRRVQVEDGTSNAPSLSFSNDLNTGLYRPAADTLALATNGVERMRIGSTGNIGIGTTNPQYLLHVANGDLFINNNYIISSDAGGSSTNVDYIVANDGSIRGCTGSWKFAHDTTKENTHLTGTSLLDCGGIYATIAGCDNYFAGKIGIGTTNPQAPLHVANGNLLTSSTHKSTLFYAPPNWSYSSTTLNQWVQLWSFTFNAPVQGIATISIAGHWQHSITNNYAYMGILVNNSHVNVSGLYDSFTVGGAGIHGGYPHHYWANVSSWATFSHTCSVKLNAGNNTVGLGSFHAAGTATYNGVGVSMQFIPLFTN